MVLKVDIYVVKIVWIKLKKKDKLGKKFEIYII